MTESSSPARTDAGFVRQPPSQARVRPRASETPARRDESTSGRVVASTATRSAMRRVLLLVGSELRDGERALGPMIGTTCHGPGAGGTALLRRGGGVDVLVQPAL